jgi:multiple sugar transport system ATP-binding protein
MRTMLSRLQRHLGTTTVYVTHDQTEAMTLGDRVAVMRAGVVQQVGPPQELYDNPANLFVAGFIGSPAMNFLHATLAGDTLRTAIGDIPVTGALRSVHAPRDLVVGIRPEHIEDATLGGDATRADGLEFTAPVDLVESMGAEKYAYLPLAGERASTAELEELAADSGAADVPSGGAQLVARLPTESRVREGEPARLWFGLKRVHLFDPQDGSHLTP